VLRLDPGLLPVKMNIGIAYYQSGEYARAAESFQSVVKSNPKEARAKHLLAVCYLQTGRYSDSAQLFSGLLPSEDVSLNVGAATAFLKSGKEVEADALLAKILEGKGGTPEIHFMIDQAHLGLNQFSEAIASFAKMVDLAPSSAEGRFYLGGAFFKQGQLPKAMEEWRSAARLDSQYFPSVFAIGVCGPGKEILTKPGTG
jgi:Flp pilus assembly protein TadD